MTASKTTHLRPRAAAAILAAACALSPRALAHGGAYNPTASNASAIPSPSVPGPSTGKPMPGGGAVPTGIVFRRESWEDWWHFNKDPYLELKRAVASGVPVTDATRAAAGPASARYGGVDFAALLRSRVAPALRDLLKSESSPDVVTAALVALARITASEGVGVASAPSPGGATRESAETAAVAVFSARLGDPNQEIAETAALALGILRSEESLPALEALLADNERGRLLAGGHQVPSRTRAFAAYGLGLVAAEARNNRARQVAARALCAALGERHAAVADVEVACVIGLSVDRLDPSSSGGSAPWVSRQSELAFLRSILDDPKRTTVARTHAVTAIARLASDAPLELRAGVEDGFLASLQARSKIENGPLQSSAQALGLLGDCGDGPVVRRMRTAIGVVLKDPDVQARWFALVALGEMAGRDGTARGEAPGGEGLEACRETLANVVASGRGAMRPWAAIGLGVLERRAADRIASTPPADGSGAPATPSPTDPRPEATQRSRDVLRAYLAEAKQRTHLGAAAIGLGLARDGGAVPLLLDRLPEATEDQGQGYLALALGMIGDTRAIAPLKAVAAKSEYRPESLEQSAVALALLGDKSTAPELAALLAKAEGQAAQSSIARALGKIGDARTIQPLLEIVGNKQLPALTRAFAVVALGQVGDLNPMPWSVPISLDLNYTATTGTLLAGDGTGILEIL